MLLGIQRQHDVLTSPQAYQISTKRRRYSVMSFITEVFRAYNIFSEKSIFQYFLKPTKKKFLSHIISHTQLNFAHKNQKFLIQTRVILWKFPYLWQSKHTKQHNNIYFYPNWIYYKLFDYLVLQTEGKLRKIPTPVKTHTRTTLKILNFQTFSHRSKGFLFKKSIYIIYPSPHYQNYYFYSEIYSYIYTWNLQYK